MPWQLERPTIVAWRRFPGALQRLGGHGAMFDLDLIECFARGIFGGEGKEALIGARNWATVKKS